VKKSMMAALALLMTGGAATAETVIKTDLSCRHLKTLQLVQRFLGSNHIREPQRVCRTMCG
jgi:hypothetical protein